MFRVLPPSIIRSANNCIYSMLFVTQLLLSAAIVEELELLGFPTPPIIRSAYNCIYSTCYLSHLCCYLPLSWKRWNSSEFQRHPLSGAHTTVSTASVICHTVAAICRYRGRVGTSWISIFYLPLSWTSWNFLEFHLLSALIVEVLELIGVPTSPR